jgi:hypothetical protein
MTPTFTLDAPATCERIRIACVDRHVAQFAPKVAAAAAAAAAPTVMAAPAAAAAL